MEKLWMKNHQTRGRRVIIHRMEVISATVECSNDASGEARNSNQGIRAEQRENLLRIEGLELSSGTQSERAYSLGRRAILEILFR